MSLVIRSALAPSTPGATTQHLRVDKNDTQVSHASSSSHEGMHSSERMFYVTGRNVIMLTIVSTLSATREVKMAWDVKQK